MNYDRLRQSSSVQGVALIMGDDPINLPGTLTPAQKYEAYITSLAPLLWLRLRETSGTTPVNSGSLAGLTITWTAGAGALGQTGQLGANEAYDFDALASIITIAATASLDLATFTEVALVRPDAAGESSVGRISNYGSGTQFTQFNGALTALRAQVGAGTAANTVATTGLTAATWALLFQTYDDAGDRKVRLYKGIAGAVAEYAYSTQDAATGTRSSVAASALNVGNRTLTDCTWDGLYDEFMMFNRILSAAEMLQITLLSGLV